MGWIRKRSQLIGAVAVVGAIMVGGALPVVLTAAAPASSLSLHHAPVAACSPPGIAAPGQPVADASPPCNPKMTATPHNDLRDNQTITVSGSGFPPDTFIPLFECQTGATSENQCETDEGNYTDSSPTGTFSTPDTVLRLISTDTTTIDCAQRRACVVAALDYNVNAVEATTAISFKNVPLPTITVAPATSLSDGQNVTVSGSNFAAGQPVFFTECPAGQSESYECDTEAEGQATPGPAGTFTVTYNVARILTTDQGFLPGSTDCAQAPGCVLAAFGNFGQQLVLPVPLAFNPTVPPLPPLDLSLALKPTGRIGVGGAVQLSGTISCTAKQPVGVTTQVSLTENAGSLLASSTLSTQPSCTKTPAVVTFTVPELTVPFVADEAEVSVGMSARDGSSVTQQTVSGSVTLSVAAHTPPLVYYIALGDSLAAGYASPPGQGYANDLLTDLQATDPNIELVDLGCSNETTTSMIEGGTCTYTSGPPVSQLEAATDFLAANRGSVALVTVDIGGNDYIQCINPFPPSYSAQCIDTTNGTVSTNLATIMGQLRAAAGASVPMVGMNYFDPFLDFWPENASGQAIAKESVPVVGTVDSTIGSAFAAASAPVADVETAFQTTDLSHKVTTPEGRVPVAVANTCNWLDFTCAKGVGGYGDDTDAAGSAIIAGAFEKVLPSGLTTASRQP